MRKWEIHLLGAPRANRGTKSARLRSRETWGVLASLALACNHGKRANIKPACCSRMSLAGRFWPDARDPSHSLRQSIASIRDELGPECVIADRQNIALAPGCATSDIEIITELLAKAVESHDDTKRLQLLSEADSYVQGGFLEGCIDPGDGAYNWFVAAKSEVNGLVIRLLEALEASQEASGDLNSALDTARKVLEYKPDDASALEQVWDLGRRANRPLAAEVLTTADEFEEALPRITRRAKKGLPLTGRESRIFDALFQSRLELLDEQTRLRYLSLAVFPAAFTAELAHKVCRTPAFVLNILADQQLLERDYQAKLFSFLEPVRALALRRVQPPSLNRLNERLFELCFEHVVGSARTGTRSAIGPFLSTEGATKYLSNALEWAITDTVSSRAITYVEHLRHTGFGSVAIRAIPRLESAVNSGTLTAQDEFSAVVFLGRLYTHAQRFRDSIEWFRRALDIATAACRTDEMPCIHAELAVACHYSEQSDYALHHNEIAHRANFELGDHVAVAGCLLFRGEILTALGDNEGLLKALTEACILYRDIGKLPLSLAECLYWLAEAYLKLGRYDEALDGLEESLRLRMDGGDATGVAHCIAKIGAMRSLQGRFAEGRANIQHAILVHEQTGDKASRAAAIGTLGDALLREGKVEAAREAYCEGLAYWQEQEHVRWCENFQRRLCKCG